MDARPAPAAVITVARYALGDQDLGAPGRDFVMRSTFDLAGTNTLTATGAPRYSYDVAPAAAVASASQLCGTFDGNGQYLKGSMVSTNADNFGLEAWVRPAVASGNHVIAYNGNTSSSGWGLFQAGGTYQILFGGSILWGAAPVTAGAWAHLALVRQGGTTTFYFNGTPQGSFQTAPFAPAAGGFAIAAPGQAVPTENFNGAIDDVRVFRFAPGDFVPSDLLYFQRHPVVQTLASESFGTGSATWMGTVDAQGQATAAWFEWGTGFNFDHVTPRMEISTNGSQPVLVTNAVAGLIPGVTYHVRLVATNGAGPGRGDIVAVTTRPTNGFGSALSLDGANQYATITPETYFDGNFTMETWIYLRSRSGNPSVLEFGNAQGVDSVGLALSGNDGVPLLFTMVGQEGASVIANTPLPLRQWVHLAATLDGHLGRVYVNGVLAAENPNLRVPQAVVRSENFIGHSVFPSSVNLDALVDEVRVWRGARTEAQIRSAMAQPLSGGEPDLLVYYRCDELPGGTTVNDLADAGGYTPAAIVNFAFLAPGLTLAPTLKSQRAVVAEGGVAFFVEANPGGADTAVWFEWGASTNYDHVTPAISQGGGTENRNVWFIDFPPLVPDVVYHYRAVATNRLGRVATPDQFFAVTVTVQNTADGGPGSLRNALTLVADWGNITFAPTLDGASINLTSGELAIDRTVEIDGPGAARLAIRGGRAQRVFRINSAQTVIQGLTISDGYAAATADAPVIDRSGGGVLATADFTLRDCVLSGNVAGRDGGALSVFSTGGVVSAWIEGCTFTSNRVAAGGNGNAIALGPMAIGSPHPLAIHLVNCTLAGNQPRPEDGDSSLWGGAIASAANELSIDSCTITSNRADVGGGLFVNSGVTRLRNSIVAGNAVSGDGPDIAQRRAGQGSLLSEGFNLIGNNSGWFANFYVGSSTPDRMGTAGSPLAAGLGILADNGGPTPTCALLPGSPALDAGGPGSTSHDQRGLPRPSGPGVDIGSFELQVTINPQSFSLAPPQLLANGDLRLVFTNGPGTPFRIDATTNFNGARPLWIPLGRPTETAPGRYEFIDPAAQRPAQRFYRAYQEIP